jgi:hypothetical protein
VQSIFRLLVGVTILSFGLGAAAQLANPKPANSKPATPQAATPKLQAKPQAAPQAQQLTPGQKFVLDTVKMAVALPQSDQQDRLRVLSAAADVVSPIDKKMAKSFWSEGVRIESELIRVGQAPAVSMMSSGQADCSAAVSFVENLPEAAAMQAEQSLIGAVTMCPKQTADTVSRKLDAAMQKGIIPSRALMATMQTLGEKSAWSQEHFAKMFASLPDPAKNAAESENLAAMYAQMSPLVDKDVAAKTGLELLDWLGKLEDTPLRGLSIRIASGAMQQALGEEAYQKALQSDVVANSTVQNVGAEREVERPAQESVSVLAAMDDKGDQTQKLSALPASMRAREAAAHGFAAGTSGDKQQARRYFDMAFSAADEVWDARTPETNAAAVVQEISEAAAQVDSLNALTRAQKLRDSSAQAIAMLAVARVVASNGITR